MGGIKLPKIKLPKLPSPPPIPKSVGKAIGSTLKDVGQTAKTIALAPTTLMTKVVDGGLKAGGSIGSSFKYVIPIMAIGGAAYVYSLVKK
jgi:hypothetical protein